MIVVRCTDCRQGFTQEEVKGASACPSCRTTTIPLDPANDVEVKINWHELRILTMWAERWADAWDRSPEGTEGKHRAPMLPTVFAIARAVQEQFPSRAPLTFSGEVQQMRDDGIAVESNVTPGGPVTRLH